MFRSRAAWAAGTLILALGGVGYWVLSSESPGGAHSLRAARLNSEPVTATPAAAPATPAADAASRTQAPPTQGATSALNAGKSPSEGASAPTAAVVPGEALSPAQFAALTTDVYRSLPTAADLRDLTEDQAHGYPEPLAKAGTQLGRIAQAVHDSPALKAQATDFYIQCAADNQLLTPVRALCYSHVIQDPKAPAAQSLPAEVVRLGRLIPPTDP